MLSSEEYDYNPLGSVVLRTCSGLISLLSLISNALLLHVLVSINELWGSFAFRIITCIAVADVLSSLAALGMAIFHSFLGYPGFIESPWFCRVFGFSMFFSYNLSGILVSLLALDRYLAIRYGKQLRPSYTWLAFSTTALISAGLLGYSTYYNAFKFDPTFSYCVPRGTGTLRITELFMGLLTNLPIVVLSFCYISIYVACLQIRRINKDFFASHLPSRALLLFFIYLFCYFPKFFSTVWKLVSGHHPPFFIYYMTPIGLTSILVFNPILVLFLSTKVYQGLLEISFFRSFHLKRRLLSDEEGQVQ